MHELLHTVPKNNDVHEQENELTPLVHDPELRQGELKQLSIKVSQVAPVHPGAQEQVKSIGTGVRSHVIVKQLAAVINRF